jgi:hypothetical protein
MTDCRGGSFRRRGCARASGRKYHGILPQSWPAGCARTVMEESGGSAPPDKRSSPQSKIFDRRCTQMHANSLTYLRPSACICGRFYLRSDRPPKCGGLCPWWTRRNQEYSRNPRLDPGIFGPPFVSPAFVSPAFVSSCLVVKSRGLAAATALPVGRRCRIQENPRPGTRRRQSRRCPRPAARGGFPPVFSR